MQINDPNKASFGAIGGILAAVAAIVIAIIWIMPKAKEIRSKHSQAATVQANIASLQATDAQLHQAYQAYLDNQTDFQNLELALPSGLNMPDLYAYFDQLASQSGVVLTSITGSDQGTAAGNSAAAAATMPATTDDGTATTAAPAMPTTAPAGAAAAANGGAPGNLGTIAFNIQITGTSTSLNQFFTALAKSLRLFNVQETDLAVTQGGTLQATLTVQAYYLK